MNRRQYLLYRFCRTVVVGFCRLYFRLSVVGREHVPASGPFILAPVHRSNVDTLVVAAATKRRMRFLGKDVMWKFKLAAAFFDAMGGIPVVRGTADRESMNRCLEALEGGEPVVVFPEGTRRTGLVVEDVFEGAAYMATRVQCPIVPVGIGGSEAAMGREHRLPRPRRVLMVIGPPMHPEKPAEGSTARAPRRAVRELSERLKAELQRLFDEARVAV